VQVKVRVSNPEQPDRGVEQVEAFIDTGASRSLTPRSLVDMLSLAALPEGKTYATLEYAGCDQPGDLDVAGAGVRPVHGNTQARRVGFVALRWGLWKS
jgi:hypothetical protein